MVKVIRVMLVGIQRNHRSGQTGCEGSTNPACSCSRGLAASASELNDPRRLIRCEGCRMHDGVRLLNPGKSSDSSMSNRILNVMTDKPCRLAGRSCGPNFLLLCPSTSSVKSVHPSIHPSSFTLFCECRHPTIHLLSKIRKGKHGLFRVISSAR